MKKLIQISILLTFILGSCSTLQFCFLTKKYSLSFFPLKPGDEVFSTQCFFFPDTCKDCPSISNIKTTGPKGLHSKYEYSYLEGPSIKYGGILKNGNDFGKCRVVITGDYSGCFDIYTDWRISGVIHVEQPTITFFPASLFIEPYGGDSCTFVVRPECRYIIYASNPDSTLEITPYRYPYIVSKSHTKLYIKDTRGFKRTSLIIFKINSDCDRSSVTKFLYITIK